MPRVFQSAGRIREPWNMGLSWAGIPRSERFNPPGGSGSLGTVKQIAAARDVPGFNPPGGSGSLGTAPLASASGRAKTALIRAACLLSGDGEVQCECAGSVP